MIISKIKKINKIIENNEWKVSKKNLKIKEKAKTFAPGNLRAVSECDNYNKLVRYWIENCYTLRYTGGMVPDIYQIFIKSEGIFTNLATKSHPAKLRLEIIIHFSYLLFIFKNLHLNNF